LNSNIIVRVVMVGFVLLALAAACAPATGEEISEVAYPSGEEIESASDAYPDDEAEDAAEPQGKPMETPPGVIVVAPSGSVDLGKLTPEPPSGEEILEEMREPGRPGDPLPAEVNQIVSALGEHLAEYAGVSPDDVQPVSAEAVTWGNTALGCPEPDTAYAEVLVEGWQVTLIAEGKTYTYHTDGLARFVLCEDGLPAAEGGIDH
jgi:hypothetical protein